MTELPVERYVAAVLGGEASVFRSSEALKAMAVTVRTYGVFMRGRHKSEGFDLCTTTHCQRFAADSVSARIQAAVDATVGELLWFRGKPAFTVYSQNCGGVTEASQAIWPDQAEPYLISHSDPYCRSTSAATWRWTGTGEQIRKALVESQLRVPEQLERISILERTSSGRAKTLLMDGGGQSVRVSATAFRFAIGRVLGWNTIKSDFYELRRINAAFLFEGRGGGHGAGLCQIGADEMGLKEKSYREILAFYYPGTEIGRNAKGIPWQRRSSEHATLFSTTPDQDSPVLAAAERILSELSAKTHWPIPTDIEIRSYPDMDAFRDSTGEPGWVAGHTSGHRIDLQPRSILRSHNALSSTLRHELIHIFVEDRAARNLPIWFREGVTGWLAGEAAAVSQIDPRSVRQRENAVTARQAYASATGRVKDLVRRYGEGAVITWISAGLPTDIERASKSPAPIKSR